MLIESFFINENSEFNIVNILGYPKVIAKIFQDEFGKNAFLIAKWLKEYKSYLTKDLKQDNKDWFKLTFLSSMFAGTKEQNLKTLLGLISSLGHGRQEYEKFLRNNSFYVDEDELDLLFSDDYSIREHGQALYEELKEEFMSETFFVITLVRAIKSGEIKDASPYKNLSFDDASAKYRNSKVFDEKAVIKNYEDGFTWRDVGPRCELTADAMRNCGSAGLMSEDPDRTLLVLFDPSNKPHIIVTYSPNEKRISGDQGLASSESKEKYHDYILDLADFLNADFDSGKTKSKSLKIKSTFKGKVQNINLIHKSIYSDFYSFDYNGSSYITNSDSVIPQSDFNEIVQYVENNPELIRTDASPFEFVLAQIFINRNTNIPNHLLRNLKSIESLHKDVNENFISYQVENFFLLEVYYDYYDEEEREHGTRCLSDNDDPDIFYHATPSRYVDSIMQNGLVTNCSPSNWPNHDYWCNDKIFLAYGFANAETWADMLGEQTGETITILAIHSKGIKGSLQPDVAAVEDNDYCAYFTTNPIAPNWITVYK